MGLPTEIGSYKILELLGTGGMGEVFLAVDERLDRRVAIKRLINSHNVPEHRHERFRREARIAAQLDHPSIVQVFGVVDHEGCECIVMEYVAGDDLHNRIKRQPLSLRAFLPLAVQIARGMAAAHDAGIIHRDLKAENILLTTTGSVKITDFGIAKILGDKTLTADGTLVGTSRAMSPEQVVGKPLDRRSDLFSFGVLAYEALTGVSPFLADSQFATLQRVAQHRHTPITDLVDIPVELAALIDQLLDKDPLLRPRDFHDVAEVLVELSGRCGEDLCVGPAVEHHRPSLRNDDDTIPGSDDEALRQATNAMSMVAATPTRRVPAGMVAATRRVPAGMVLMVPAVLIAGLGFWLASQRSPAGSELHVAVLEPEFRVEFPEEESFRRSVHSDLRAALRSVDGVQLIPDSVLTARLARDDGPPDWQRLMTEIGADERIHARIQCLPQAGCTLSLERINAAGTSPGHAEIQFFPDDWLRSSAAITTLVDRTLFPDRAWLARDPPVEDRHYQQLRRLRQRYWDYRTDQPIEDLLAALEELREQADEFLDVYHVEAEVLINLYRQTEEQRYLNRARDLIDQAHRIAPDSPLVESQRFAVSLLPPRDVSAAQRILASQERRNPGGAWTRVMRGLLLFDRGDYEAARSEYEAAARLHPTWRIMYYLAEVAIKQRDFLAAREYVSELRRRAPHNREAQALMGIIEHHARRPACVIKSLQPLVAERHRFFECRILGLAQLELDRYSDALANLQCALAFRPDAVDQLFEVAEALKLANRPHQAAFRRLLAGLDRLSGHEREALLSIKAQSLAHLAATDHDAATQAREAANQAREAANQARDAANQARAAANQARDAANQLYDRWLQDRSDYDLYAASVVYVLLGDDESAARLVDQFLESESVDVSWLRFPWFDRLREDPRLAARMKMPGRNQRCE